MNAKEFNKALSERMNFTQADVVRHLKSLAGIMKTAFSDRKGITFQHFGTFLPKKIESRKGYSPFLKKHVLYPPKMVLYYHASEALREKVKNIESK